MASFAGPRPSLPLPTLWISVLEVFFRLGQHRNTLHRLARPALPNSSSSPHHSHQQRSPAYRSLAGRHTSGRHSGSSPSLKILLGARKQSSCVSSPQRKLRTLPEGLPKVDEVSFRNLHRRIDPDKTLYEIFCWSIMRVEKLGLFTILVEPHLQRRELSVAPRNIEGALFIRRKQ